MLLTLVLLNLDMCCFANSVDSDQLASDLNCLPLSMQIYINNLDWVIWLAENQTRTWHLNLFSRTKVKGLDTYGKLPAMFDKGDNFCCLETVFETQTNAADRSMQLHQLASCAVPSLQLPLLMDMNKSKLDFLETQVNSFND